MSHRPPAKTSMGHSSRSWLKTTVAFVPFLALIGSAWLYAIHLDTLANQSMYNAKLQSRQQHQHESLENGFWQRQQQQQQPQQPNATATKDSVVIGDSKDKIFYFVQVSDLHISTFRKASTSNFYTFLSTALPLIDPAFVVVTGDLTDAKDKQLVGSMQYLDEWITYKDALDESGVLKKRNGTFWHDLRGNHDCFNVPDWNSKENLYAEMSATKTPGFMFDVRADYGKYGFIGIDACPKPGPARPYNFFGLFETPDMDNLAKRLSLSQGNNHTFVFSHYPVTTTMFGRTSAGESFADLSKSFSVYMCGHLHKLKWGLGDALQAYQPTHFLELEVGDMKQNGLYRIMVVDHDMISFADVSMPMTTIPSAILPAHPEDAYIEHDDESGDSNTDLSGSKKKKKRPALGRRLPTNPIIVVSNPKDSRYLIPKHEPVGRIATSTHIRFLVWTDSQAPPPEFHEHMRKEIKIELRIDGKLHLNPSTFAGVREEDKTEDEDFLPLYVSKWDPQQYNDGKEHRLDIKVIDRYGRVSSSHTIFRVDGQRSEMNGGFAEWIMWANVALMLKVLFTTGYLFVVMVLLVLPKLYSLYLQTSPPPSAPSPLSSSSEAATNSQHFDEKETLSTQRVFKNGYDAWLDRKCRHLYRLSSTLSTVPSRRRFWNRTVNHTIHAHVLRFVHFSTQPILFYTTLVFTLMLVTVPHFWGNFVPAAGDRGQGYFYLQGIFLPHAGGHLGGGLGAASVDHAGPDRIPKPLSIIFGAISSLTGSSGRAGTGMGSEGSGATVAGTWIPMADTWMSTIWTVIYDLVIFLYYLTLCATPSGYLYSPSNAHRLRPYHRTWYVRCLIFGIWVFRCCSVLMTAELYGPSVIWTGIGTWWLAVVGWLMFMVGWSRSRYEKDIISLRDGEEEGALLLDHAEALVGQQQVASSSSLSSSHQEPKQHQQRLNQQERIRLLASDYVRADEMDEKVTLIGEDEKHENEHEHDQGEISIPNTDMKLHQLHEMDDKNGVELGVGQKRHARGRRGRQAKPSGPSEQP
ncbi:Transmembrane protein 62 [Podila epigama]|nr:Transmembrane protein 62 [Podila epigama]